MKINDGIIVEATEHELFEKWSRHWSNFYSFKEYCSRCQANGTKIVEEDKKEQMTIKKFYEDLLSLYRAKNTAYGNSTHDTYKKFGNVSYIVRMTDKANRIKSLMNNPKIESNDESILDTWADLSAYALICAADMYCKIYDGYEHSKRVEEYMQILSEQEEYMDDYASAFVEEYTIDEKFDLSDALYRIYCEDECISTFILLSCYAASQYIDIKNKGENNND